MKKIIVINSSPRKGANSDAIAAEIQKKAEGAEVRIVNFRDSTINPCMGCNVCKTKNTPQCIQTDDMARLIPEIDACDGLVLISPVYFGTVNGPMKTVVDRLYSFYAPAKPNMTCATKSGKKGVVIVCCAAPDEPYAGEAERYAEQLALVGCGETKSYCASGLAVENSAVNNADVMAKIDEIAAWLTV